MRYTHQTSAKASDLLTTEPVSVSKPTSSSPTSFLNSILRSGMSDLEAVILRLLCGLLTAQPCLLQCPAGNQASTLITVP